MNEHQPQEGPFMAGHGRSIGRYERLLNIAEPTFEICARIGEIDPKRPAVLLKSGRSV